MGYFFVVFKAAKFPLNSRHFYGAGIKGMQMVGTSSLPFMKAAVKLAPDCKVLRCGRGSHLWNQKSRRDKKPGLVVTKCLVCYDF